MPTQRQKLFDAKIGSSESDVIPAKVRFKHNKRKGFIEPLSAEEKLLCALRKILTEMSDADSNGCRYYIAGNKVLLTQRPTTTAGRPGEPQSYHARGRCRVKLCHPEGHISAKVIEFSVGYRDTEDEMGLADVEYLESSTIDELPRDTPIDVSAL